MDNKPGQGGEFVWITADVVFHRDALRTAVPAPTADRPGSARATRETQLALDFPDETDEDAC
jgi:hypothetical protein